jgi:hypothetical protein
MEIFDNSFKMADNLKEICLCLVQSLDLEMISNLDLANFKRISKEILKTEHLPEELNLSHILEKHSRRYTLKNCNSYHCFDCLHNLVNLGVKTCDHLKPLTNYEILHLKFLMKNLKNSNTY